MKYPEKLLPWVKQAFPKEVWLHDLLERDGDTKNVDAAIWHIKYTSYDKPTQYQANAQILWDAYNAWKGTRLLGGTIQLPELAEAV